MQFLEQDMLELTTRNGQGRAPFVRLASAASLIAACALFLYGVAWTYSTRRYLKGFADAIVPLDGSSQEKTEALLSWFRQEPGRNEEAIEGSSATLRDPVSIVQNARLLKICGSATNAFINLADAAGLRTRRLLLLDSSGGAMHVIAEVKWDGRWVAVNPQTGQAFKDKSGRALAKEELRDPAVFRNAISRMPGYSPTYSFEHTAYVHLQRIAFAGGRLQSIFDRMPPRWQQAIDWGYYAENPSLWPPFWAAPLLLAGVLLRLASRRSRRAAVRAAKDPEIVDEPAFQSSIVNRESTIP